jgi:GH15 family glucan-1,4-alpha-glucosidase
VDETNVLETRFQTETGTILLTDLMPVASEEEQKNLLLPEHEILRLIECERGEIEVEIVFDCRPQYAERAARIHDAGAIGLRVETGYGLCTLRSGVPLSVLSDGRVYARARLRAGEALDFSLTFSVEWPAVLPTLGQRTREAIARSIAWWKRWSSRLKYDGPGRDAVIRSALVLRLLFYAPSGAIVAAPTTSLSRARRRKS